MTSKEFTCVFYDVVSGEDTTLAVKRRKAVFRGGHDEEVIIAAVEGNYKTADEVDDVIEHDLKCQKTLAWLCLTIDQARTLSKMLADLVGGDEGEG